jgi:hypothetical protein
MEKVLLALVGVVLLAFGLPNAFAQTDAAKVKDAVEFLIQNGALRVDVDQRKAWIDPAVWESLDAQNKEKTTVVIAMFVSPKNPMVTLYDKQSSREVASYGPFQGLKVK